MDAVINNIAKYKDEYLIIDGTIPVLTNSVIRDELTLYCLADEQEDALIAAYSQLIKRHVSQNTRLGTLSYGQKLILSVLCAVYSTAPKVQLKNVYSSLDGSMQRAINDLIDAARLKGRVFLVEND
ncbi:hypothetical protein ACWKWU_11135 [Chitinophaga lutea]